MAFENKKNMLKQALDNSEMQTTKKEIVPPDNDLRKVKSYTLRQSLANELSKRAAADKRSASNFLEHILEDYFNN